MHRRDTGVVSKAKGQIVVAAGFEQGQRAFQVLARFSILSCKPMRDSHCTVSDPGLRGIGIGCDVAQKRRRVREMGRAAKRERDVNEGASRGGYSAGRGRSDATCFRGRRGVARPAHPRQSEPTPFGDWVQRRVLQKLRGAPFDPGVPRFCEPRMELLDEP